MTFDAWLPALILLSSLVPGVLIFFLDEERHALRTALNLAGALLKLVLVGWQKEGQVCCITMIKAEALAGMVKGMLGPMMMNMAS